jgi:hypothetical protein
VEKAFRKPVELLLVFLLTLAISNRASAAFVIRHAPAVTTTAGEGSPAPDAQVETRYEEIKTRLTTQDYKLFNFDRPNRVFDMQRKRANDLAKAGGLCAMLGTAGALISVGFNLENAVTYSFIGLIVVGVVLIVIGITGMQRTKKKTLAVTAPKNNEVGIAYNF